MILLAGTNFNTKKLQQIETSAMFLTLSYFSGVPELDTTNAYT